MAARRLRRRPWLKAASSVALFGGGAFVATSEEPSTAFKICTIVPVRTLRLSFAAATIVFDYEYSLRGLEEGSGDYAKTKHEVHLRSARRLQELCFWNGWIDIELGQHIAQLMYASRLLPQISELLRRLPWVILLMLKTNDCIRAVNNSLLQRASLEQY